MANEHVFTVVTPNLNQGIYLLDNINSVLLQQNKVQHLLFDGGSIDTSLSILQEQQHNLSFWTSESDSGQSNAINKGLQMATGKYITWLNSDDYLLPDSLRFVSDMFEAHPEVDVVHGSAVLVDELKSHIGIDHGQKHGLPYRYYAGMCFPQPASFFRGSLLNEVGFLSENLHYGMDYEFFLRLRLRQSSFLRLNKPLAAYRLHEQSKTVSFPIGFANEWIQIYNNFLHGESNSKPILKLLATLDLYREQTSHYSRNYSLNPDSLKKTLLYALHYQAYFRYMSMQYSYVTKIIKLILTQFPLSRLTYPLTHMYMSSIIKQNTSK